MDRHQNQATPEAAGGLTLSGQLAPLQVIRVETALSRYPIHRLAKKGDLSIEIRQQNPAGEVEVKWEVSHNSKYGQPGPLAYKLDTLVINRRIDEAQRPVPKVLRLGSLREIAAEAQTGEGNTAKVKRALYQNAGAFVTVKTTYKGPKGALNTLEAGFSRYSVVMTGETLPDGQVADAVYLLLNDIYAEVLNSAQTRPLDYDYLRGLPPGAQRFYELLSYQMFAALKHGRPRAKLVYSEYCTYAPQTRYRDFQHVKKQMYKLYARHRRSGYLAEVEFEPAPDGQGEPDWLMFFAPGPRAREEFRGFTGRTAEPPALERPEQPPAEPGLVRDLVGRGVTARAAAELARAHPEARLREKFEVFDWLVESRDHRVGRSPAGYLVRSIKEDYAPPADYVPPAERARRAEEGARRARRAESGRRRKEERDEARRARAEEYWGGLPAPEQERLSAEALAQASPFARSEYQARRGSDPEAAGLWLRSIVAAHVSALLDRQATPPGWGAAASGAEDRGVKVREGRKKPTT